MRAPARKPLLLAIAGIGVVAVGVIIAVLVVSRRKPTLSDDDYNSTMTKIASNGTDEGAASGIEGNILSVHRPSAPGAPLWFDYTMTSQEYLQVSVSDEGARTKAAFALVTAALTNGTKYEPRKR